MRCLVLRKDAGDNGIEVPHYFENWQSVPSSERSEGPLMGSYCRYSSLPDGVSDSFC